MVTRYYCRTWVRGGDVWLEELLWENTILHLETNF